jgi:hypothetical protein
MVLSGHLHMSHVGSTEQRFPLEGYSVIVIQAGTATSTRSRGETNSFNVIRIDEEAVGVERWAWHPDEGHFKSAGHESFARVKGHSRPAP